MGAPHSPDRLADLARVADQSAAAVGLTPGSDVVARRDRLALDAARAENAAHEAAAPWRAALEALDAGQDPGAVLRHLAASQLDAVHVDARAIRARHRYAIGEVERLEASRQTRRPEPPLPPGTISTAAAARRQAVNAIPLVISPRPQPGEA